MGELSRLVIGRPLVALAETLGSQTGPGAKVRRGDPLMVIEAMKMEHTVTAPADGVIEAVRFAVGDLVEEGAELVALTPQHREPG